MKLLLKLSLALLMSVSFAKVSFAQDMALEEEGEEFFEDGTETRGCKRVKCLVVCGSATVGGTLSVSGNESVGGNVAVAGSVTGSSFAVSPAPAVGTAGVPAIGGALAWGEVGNINTAYPTTANSVIPMSYIGSSISSNMTGATGAAGGITVADAGVYLLQYEFSNTANVIPTIQLVYTPQGGTVTAVPNSTLTATAVATGQQLSGTVLITLGAGALIQMTNVSGTAITVPTTGVGAKITAIRIA